MKIENTKDKLINQYKDALKEAQNLYLAQDHTEAEIEERKINDINKLEEFIKIIYGM